MLFGNVLMLIVFEMVYILIFYVKWVNWCFNLKIGVFIGWMLWLIFLVILCLVCLFLNIGNCYILCNNFFLCFCNRYWFWLFLIKKMDCLIIFLFIFLDLIGNFLNVFLLNVL